MSNIHRLQKKRKCELLAIFGEECSFKMSETKFHTSFKKKMNISSVKDFIEEITSITDDHIRLRQAKKIIARF